MKTSIRGPMISVFLIVLLSCVPGPAISTVKNNGTSGDARISQGKASAVDREILVKFKPSAGEKRIREIAEAEGLDIIKVVTPPSLYLMRDRGQNTKRLLKELTRYEEIEYAEPNYIYGPSGK